MLLSKNNTPIIKKNTGSGFNPYFSGCFSLSRNANPDNQWYQGSFNPYFSGCFSLRYCHCLVIIPGMMMFQSLFFWMLLSKTAGTTESRTKSTIRFNPYFSGCFSLSPCRHHPDLCSCGFQSLFFWMLLSKTTSQAICAKTTYTVSILIFLDASL